MSHPGPPRFVATGEDVELAPRDPDPAATYRWHLVRRPDESNAKLGEEPVEHLVPDAPGRYVARLSAPDGEHDLTVRAFPGELAASGQQSSGLSAGRSGGVSRMESGPRSSGSGGSVRAGTGEGGGGGRPRLTLQPVVDGGEVVVEADPTPHPDGSETAGDIPVEFVVDDRDDVDADAMVVTDHELRLPVEALSGRTRIHAVAVGAEGYSVPDAVAFEPAAGGSDDAAVTVERPYDPPGWAESSVIYEVYVREFAEAEDAFDALVDRLDYIESLGVDTIWLTPVLENDHAPHGYNIADFTSIAADLGTREDYERFLDAAHGRGLRVLFDFVCNHSARTHPYFQAAVEDTDSEYRDWYEWRTETEPETYFEWEHIANFDFDHLPVRRHLLDAVDEWAPLVDGFRCDMAWAVPNGFWREVHDRCKSEDAEFLLLDETIPYIPEYQAGLFDMHFDSTTYAALRRVGNGEDAEALLDAVDGRAEIGFPEHAAFMLYAENHDETRYVTECGRDAAEAAAGALFTLPGAPLLYAGQEFGHRGRRDTLAWDHADEELRDFVRSLSAVRGRHSALSPAGTLERVPYEVRHGPEEAVVAFARSTEEAAVVVVLNFGSEPATVAVPAVAGTTDLVADASVAAEAPGTTVSVESIVVLPAAAGPLE
ncbi:alpha-amylase [Halobacteriales archaeon QH_10_70_21]|nr:MAG: alpha-amylase [Halobacteriales archaeon QH_10_70_21]